MEKYHYLDQPDGIFLARAFGMPAFNRDFESDIPATFARPLVPLGICLAAHDHVHDIVVVASVHEVGRLVGSITEWCSRNGLEFALQAAIDQGAAWARSAPR